MADDNEVKTVVTYEVDDALDALKKLDKGAAAAAKRTSDAFDKAGRKTEDFEDTLDGATGGIGTFAGKAAGLAFAFNQIVEFGGKAVQMIGQIGDKVAKEIFNFETLTETIEDFAAQLDRITESRGAGAEFERANIEGDLQAQLRNLRAESIPIRQEQAENKLVQQSLNTRLAAHKKFYADLRAISSQSTSDRESLEEQLNDTIGRINDRRAKAGASRGNPAQQVSALLDQAAKLRDAGQFDRSENFLSDALDAAQGNASLIRQVEEAENALVEAMKKNVQAAKAVEQSDLNRLNAQNAIIEGLTAEIELLKLRQAELAKARTDNKVEQTQIRNEAEVAGLDVDRTQAQQRLDDVTRELNNTLDAQVSKYERLKNAAGAFFSLQSFSTLNDQAKGIELLQTKVDELFQSLQDDQSPENVRRVSAELNKFTQALGVVQNEDNLSSVLQPDLKQLEQGRALLLDMIDALSRLRRADAALQGAPISPTARPGAPAAGGNQGAAANNVTRTTNVTANVQIRGGLIDNETARQVAEIVKRELRRGTSEA